MSLILFGGIEILDFEVEASGGIAFGGVATVDVTLRERGGHRTNFNFTANGGLIFAGAATVTREVSFNTSGGLVFGGAAEVENELPPPGIVFIYEATGGLLFAGAAVIAVEKAFVATGGLVFGGSAQHSLDFTVITQPDEASVVPLVYIAQPNWPGRILAELPSASGVDYAWAQGDPRPAAFTVIESEPALNRDVRQPGNRVVIEWPPFDPWVGYLVTAEKASNSGLIELTALDCLEILNGRETPQNTVYAKPIASGVIIRYLLDVANEDDTGIRAGNIELGPSVEDIQLGGQSVLEAMREVCERTGYQVWTRSFVTPNHIETRFYYGRRQGDDLRHKLHMYEGVHFTEARAKIDVTQVVQSRTYIGDFGMDVKDRHSVTRTTKLTGTSWSQARRVTGLLAGSSYRDLPPGLRNASVNIEVMTSNLSELDRRAEHEQEAMIEQQAQFNDVVALPSLTSEQLAWLKVGNIWTRHARFDDDIEDVVRINYVQANPEDGLAQVGSVAVLR